MRRRNASRQRAKRPGAIIIFVAITIAVLVIVMAMSIDIGFVAVTKTQLQAADDASTLAGGTQLHKGLGVGATLTPAETLTLATQTAVDYAALHRNGDLASTYANGGRDVRFGHATFDPDSGIWTKSWGAQPYNMIGVTLHRDQGAGGPDGALPLFFGGILLSNTANVTTTAAAALIPGSTFSVEPGETAPVLPFAIDEETWNNLINGVGTLSDNYSYDEDTGAVSQGSDGVNEIRLYPEGAFVETGNFGTWDAGSADNSNADTTRQILNGMNEDDLSYFSYNGEEGTLGASEEQPLIVDADTGLSAGFKDELASIIGQPRAVAVYRTLEGPGDTGQYTIIKFVGIRIMAVDLTGSPQNKHVTVQPATLVDGSINPDWDGEITEESMFAPLMLIE